MREILDEVFAMEILSDDEVERVGELMNKYPEYYRDWEERHELALRV